MPCCVLVCLADTQQTVTLMRKMWVRRTVERLLSHIARGFPYIQTNIHIHTLNRTGYINYISGCSCARWWRRRRNGRKYRHNSWHPLDLPLRFLFVNY